MAKACAEHTVPSKSVSQEERSKESKQRDELIEIPINGWKVVTRKARRHSRRFYSSIRSIRSRAVCTTRARAVERQEAPTCQPAGRAHQYLCEESARVEYEYRKRNTLLPTDSISTHLLRSLQPDTGPRSSCLRAASLFFPSLCSAGCQFMRIIIERVSSSVREAQRC